MVEKYAVLDNKLLPWDVAELLLSEGVGDLFVSVEVVLETDNIPGFFCLEDLLSDARRKGIIHSWSVNTISEMLVKLMKNSSMICKEMIVKLVQGENTYLYAYFP